jgi:hypothetical protein
MSEIPANCVLNKGITGCGATTLAIKQPGNTIIAVPFIGLIQNKVHQIGDTLLGIYGEGDKSQEIKSYIKTHSPIKIMTTYDSLEKVCSTLSEQGFNPYKEAHLIVDEWHILFQAYLFRNNAVRTVLNTAKQFERVTYISATPIERKN